MAASCLAGSIARAWLVVASGCAQPVHASASWQRLHIFAPAFHAESMQAASDLASNMLARPARAIGGSVGIAEMTHDEAR
jgi:hypothetical protein